MKNLKYPKKGDKENVLEVICLGEIIEAFEDEALVPYTQNRGEFGVDYNRAKKIAENFDPNSFGAVHVSWVDNSFRLLDAHHRVAALMILTESGNLTDFIELFEVPLVMVPEQMALEVYQRLNAGKSHTGAQKATNSDFILGKYLKILKQNADFKMPNSWNQTTIDCALALEEKGQGNVEIEDIYAARPRSSELLDTAIDKKDFAFSAATLDQMKVCLGQFSELYAALKSKTDAGSNFNSLIKNPGFYMGFMADMLGERKFCDRSLDKLVKTSVSKSSNLLRYSKTISRRNVKELRYDKFEAVLRAGN